MIVHHTELAAFREAHSDKAIAYSGGVFDLLNRGHLQLFSRLRAAAEISVVGVTPDSRATFRKGPTRPINPIDTRLAIVDAMRDVDFCFESPDQPSGGVPYIGYNVLKNLRPDVFISSDPAWEEDRLWLAEQGTKLQIVDRFDPTVSTTATIDHILEVHGYPPVAPQ